MPAIGVRKAGPNRIAETKFDRRAPFVGPFAFPANPSESRKRKTICSIYGKLCRPAGRRVNVGTALPGIRDQGELGNGPLFLRES